MSYRTIHLSTSVTFVALALSACAAFANSDLGSPVQAVPSPAAARTGVVEVDAARLPYTDTEGKGEAVVFLHPATGNIRSWGYQQPALAAAGYRVITYSRRGHAGSETLTGSQAISAAADLEKLLNHLGVSRAHLVGVAAGGIYATDFALARPERVRSLTIAASIVAISDVQYMRESSALRPEGFDRMPSEFRELGPQYRATSPAGVAQWQAIERENGISPATSAQQRPPLMSRLDLPALSSLRAPVLLIAGSADLYSPPAMFARMARQIAGSSVTVLEGSGHSPHWERPDEFNAALLRFLRGLPR